LRNIFLAGLLAILPVSITYILLAFVFQKADKLSQPLVHRLLEVVSANGHLEIKYIPGLGVAVSILIIFLVGLFVTNVLGKRLIAMLERILHRIPLVSNIYTASKQFLEALSLSSQGNFSRVVLVEYPRRGVYSVGFVTGESKGEIQARTEKRMLNLFIPTTPNPTSGMLIMVPAEEIIPLEMTVEEGIKLVVSGGMIVPGQEIRRLEEKEEC